MLKENRGKVIISSILILLPMFVGFLLWDKLPDIMVSHWGLDGAPDGHSTKLFTITVPFLFMVLIHWFCLFFTAKDYGNKEQSPKVMNIIFWIIPILSIIMGGFVYGIGLGMEFNPAMIVMPMVGILFIWIGNYMPKCKQNSTIGIKIPWTLQNEENWNVTHRFGGKIWVAGGFFILCAAFLPMETGFPFFFIGIFALVLVPFLYSYRYYLKQKKEGSWTSDHVTYNPQAIKLGTRLSSIIVIPLLIFIGIIMFTGDIGYRYDDTFFTIEADFWPDVTVKYENIKGITCRDDVEAGFRTSGFESARLGMGSFENKEFGNYTRYCYENCKVCVVLEVGNKMLVINGEDEKATKEIYESIKKHLN